MKYLHLSTYHLCWARDALLICRPIPDIGEGMPRRQSPSLDLELAPWWLTLPGGFAPRRHDTNPGTGLVCQSCHLPASHPVRESEGQMGGGGGVGGWGVYHVPYSDAQGGRDYNEVLFVWQIVNICHIVWRTCGQWLTCQCGDCKLWVALIMILHQGYTTSNIRRIHMNMYTKFHRNMGSSGLNICVSGGPKEDVTIWKWEYKYHHIENVKNV